MRLISLAAISIAVPLAASAHVTVWPRQSALGAYERYVIRAPNEKQVPTTRIEARFPAEVQVISFAEVPGWRIETLRDAGGRIVGAAWTGSLPPERFVEFPIMAINPKAGDALSWSFVQTYQDGTRIEWSGAAGSKTPASRVDLVPAADSAHHH